VGFVRRTVDLLARRWWFFASMAVAAALALAFSAGVPTLVVGVVYAVVNSGGVWIYCDHLEDRSPRRQQWLQWLAVVLVPVGFVTVFMTPAGPRRSDALEAADDRLRADAAGAVDNTTSPHH